MLGGIWKNKLQEEHDFKCSRCVKQKGGPKALQKHKEAHHIDTICRKNCGKSFPSRKEEVKHYKSRHKAHTNYSELPVLALSAMLNSPGRKDFNNICWRYMNRLKWRGRSKPLLSTDQDCWIWTWSWWNQTQNCLHRTQSWWNLPLSNCFLQKLNTGAPTNSTSLPTPPCQPHNSHLNLGFRPIKTKHMVLVLLKAEADY